MKTLNSNDYYILASEVQLELFCFNFELDLNDIKNNGKKSTIGELYLYHLCDSNLLKLKRAKKLGMIILREYQVLQLGVPDYKELKNENGDFLTIEELYNWLYSFNIIESLDIINDEADINSKLDTFNNQLSLWRI